MRATVRGAVLATFTVGAALVLPRDLVLPLFALLLAFAAAVYVGFAEAGAPENEKRVQWIVALGFVGLALLGLHLSPWILALGWALHTVWDFLHHQEILKTRTADWYPGACLAYDLVVAGFIVVWTGWLV